MKSQNGITLIALVITIIVMLILVAVTVTIAVDDGLFSRAKDAAELTNTRMEEEQQLASGMILVPVYENGVIVNYVPTDIVDYAGTFTTK